MGNMCCGGGGGNGGVDRDGTAPSCAKKRSSANAEFPFSDSSPVFPQDSSSYHLSLSKKDSGGSRIGRTPSPAGLSSTTALMSAAAASPRDGSTSPSIGVDNGGGGGSASIGSSKMGFVAGLIAPIARSGSNGGGELAIVGANGTNNNGKAPSDSKIHALYSKYKDAREDMVLSEGIESFCLDLELKPEEFKVLVLAWKCGAEKMCRFSRAEFFRGCRSLRADTLRGLKTRLPEAVAEVRADSAAFKDLYRFTFRFGLEGGQKALPVEMAVSLWLLVFSHNEPPLLTRWVRFLQSAESPAHGIPRDTWNMFLNLIEAIGDGDLSSYDDSEAWPSLFDDFIEQENDKANQNVIVEAVEKGAGDDVGL